MKTFFLAACSLVALSSMAMAAPPHRVKAPVKKTPLVCPVSGDKIASARTAASHSLYKGKTYYFCCPDCKPRFDKNPAQITKNAAAHKYEKM